jgi:glycosyltransferase involved in cell wall biosynthesis
VIQLAAALKDAGADPTIVTLAGLLSGDPDGFPVRNWSDRRPMGVKAVLVRLARTASGAPLLGWAVRVLETYTALAYAEEIRASLRASAMLVVSGETAGLLCFARVHPRTRISARLRDFRRGSRPQGAADVLRRLLENQLSRWVVRLRNTSYVTDGERLADDYRETGFEGSLRYIPPVGVIPKSTPPVSRCREQLHLSPTAVVLLVFGVGHAGKDYSTIFRALQARADAGGDEMTILFAGRSTAGNDPRALARAYHLEGQVSVHDAFIPKERVPIYFGAADCVLMSYVDAFSMDSGVLADAMAFGKPVIASDVGSVGRSVRDRGFGLVFAPNDAQGLRSRIDEFVRLSSEERSALANRAREAGRGMSWKNIARAHLATIDGAI